MSLLILLWLSLFVLSSRVYFEFLLNQGKPNEITYEFSPQEPFRGPIEYNKSYLKVNPVLPTHQNLSLLFSTKMITFSGLYINLNPGDTLLSLPIVLFLFIVYQIYSIQVIYINYKNP